MSDKDSISREKLKEMLTQSDELLRGLLDMANDGILVIQDEEIVFANDAILKMLSYDAGELAGDLVEDIVDPLERRYHPEKLDILIGEKSGRSSFATRLQSKDKGLVSVEIGTNDFDYDGAPAVVAIVRDLTMSMSLEAAASESETRFRALHDTSPIAYFTLDSNGIIKDTNAAAERLLGYEKNQMIGLNIVGYMPEEENSPGEQVIREILRGSIIKGLEIEMVNADSKRIWVTVTGSPLSMNKERPTEIGFMVIDVHRRKEAEEREISARERAELYLEVMTTDLHTFNQSTAFTIELVETMASLPESIQGVVKESALTIKRAARMIANVRTLITLENSPPRTKKTDIYAHFKRPSIEADRDFSWKTLNVNSNINDDEFEVSGHQFLWIVFFNIIHNALLHNESNVIDLDVIASREDYNREIRIEFTDRGPGIPDEIKDRIFRRSAVTGSKVMTQGLGLTLVDQVVRELGGRIWVENRVKDDQSQGCKFVVILPAWKDEMELPCGRESCITFYKAEHCVFCGPVFDILMDVLEEFGISKHAVKVVRVDEPGSEKSEEDLPGLPTIEICEESLTGLVSEEEIRSKIVQMMVSGCDRGPVT